MKRRTILSTLLAISLTLPIVLLSRFGIEVADSGWATVLTRDFLTDSRMIGAAAPWYLTWGLGRLVTVWEPEGINALRLAGFIPYLISGMAVWFVYLRLNKESTLIALSILAAAIVSYGTAASYYFHYNTVSTAFAVVALSLLIAADSEKKYKGAFCILAGLLLVASISSRLASAAMIIPAGYVCIQLQQDRIKSIFYCHLGALLGLGLLIAASFLLGNLEEYSSGLLHFLASSFSADAQTSHPGSLITNIYVGTVKRVVGNAVLFCVAAALLEQYLEGRNKSRLLLSLLAAALALYMSRGVMQQSLVAALIIVAVLRGTEQEAGTPRILRTALVAGSLLALLFPLGSANGFANATIAVWFLIPGLVAVCRTTRQGKIDQRDIAVLVLIAACTFGALGNSTHPYWDKGFSELKCTMEGKHVHGIRTTCDRKKVLEEVIEVVGKYAANGEAILVVQNSPMIYALTGTRPWIKYPWPFLRSPENIESEIALRERERQGLPRIIVMDRLNAFGSAWPLTDEEPLENIYFSKDKTHSPIYKDFIQRHQFKLVFENRMYYVFSR